MEATSKAQALVAIVAPADAKASDLDKETGKWNIHWIVKANRGSD